MADLIITEKANITAIADKVRALDNSSASLNFEEMKDKLTSERQNVDGALAALAEKGVEVPEGSTAAALPELIGNIQASSSAVEKKDISFYDYDGTLLYSYTIEEANALTALPAGPTHEGLVFDGWNWSLDDVKSLTRPMNIGAMYATDDGTTHIYIHLEEGRTSPMLGICPNGTVTVDWGDGTAPNTLTGTSLSAVKWTPTHHYADPGDYVIRLTVDGIAGMYGTNNANTHSYLLRYESSADARNYVYQNAIQKVEIGNGIRIGNYAFLHCHSLASITIPCGMTNIGNYAFQYCYSLASITIPDGVTSIGNYAFQYCYSLASITIPYGVTSLGSTTFQYCYSLASITIPDGVTSIGSYTFQYCHSLANLTIPYGVTNIGIYAFQYCYPLASLTISGSVTSIGSYAFYSCYSVAYYDFTSHTSVPALSNTNAFNNISADCEIRVPASLAEEWKAATNWATYADYIVGV